MRSHVGRVIVGQDEVVERVLISLLTGGHLLLQGVPGLAKTLLVQAVSRAVSLQFGRVQFTVDLLPADIVGAEMLDESRGGFYVRKGPIFTNLLLADEINRATPKVQSALLEAMQERRVTIGGETFDLPSPFLVIATQNPVEQSGTFELPEAQLDRFLMCHRLEYPTPQQESQIVRRSLDLGVKSDDQGGTRPMSAFDAIDSEPAATLDDLVSGMKSVHDVHVSDAFVEHCVQLAVRTREHPEIELGCSPRAPIAVVQAARARAFIRGRSYVTPEDLFALAEDVLAHRMRPTYDAAARGRTSSAIVQDILREAF
ncbi:MAG: MoxR family ATPase [Planctomycetota bacterium]